MIPDERSKYADALEEIFGLLNTQTVALQRFVKAASFKGSEVSEAPAAATASAREEHLRRGFGFWEFVLEQLPELDEMTRSGLIQRALWHGGAEVNNFAVDTDLLLADLRKGKFDSLPGREIVALSSRLPGRDVHIPMLDCGARSTESGTHIVRQVLRHLDVRGGLFTSGRSYHFVGTTPMSTPELLTFWGRAQLLSPVIDTRWISHALIEGNGALRISTDEERHAVAPTLVAWID